MTARRVSVGRPRVGSMTLSDFAHPSHTELLLRYLQRERENLIGTLDGVSDYDAAAR